MFDAMDGLSSEVICQALENVLSNFLRLKEISALDSRIIFQGKAFERILIFNWYWLRSLDFTVIFQFATSE
jgi:hypothetical protein